MKKQITLKQIFKEYMENCILSSRITDTIKCYMKDYEIINNTDDNWCFNELGYMRYKYVSPGLKDVDTIEFFRYSDCEIIKGSEGLKYFTEDEGISIYKDFKYLKFFIVDTLIEMTSNDTSIEYMIEVAKDNKDTIFETNL